MAQQSMLMGLLKTPSQVRQEQQERLMQESLARSQQMITGGGTTALPGILSRYGAQAAQRGAMAGAGLLRGVTGGLGTAVGGDMGQRIADLGVTAEERQARSRQQAISGLNMGDSKSLMEAAKKLSAMGDVAGAQALIQQAQALEKTSAETALTRAQISTEAAKQARAMAAAGYDQARIQETLGKMSLELDNLAVDLIVKQERAKSLAAGTVKTETETSQMKAKFPVEMLGMELQNQATSQGIVVDQARVNLINSQVSSEEVKRRAQESQISLDQARTELVKEETERYIQMTPSEVLKSALGVKKIEGEIEENKSQVTLNKARLADIGQTEFTRELEALVRDGYYTQNQANKLIETRLTTLANKGSLGQQIRVEGAKTNIKAVAAYTASVAGANRVMDSSLEGLKYLRDADTGTYRSGQELLTYISSRLGQKAGLDAKANNELLDVLLGGVALENASNLKGALSDKDLAFVKELAGNRNMSPRALATLFGKQYATAYAQDMTARAMETIIAESDPQTMSTFKIATIRSDLEKAYKITGQQQFASELAIIFPEEEQ